MDYKLVYLMRGLPSSGKSYTARRLAGDCGVVLETDEYFYTHIGDDANRYDFSKELLPEARRWNYKRFQHAVASGISPIVVDRGNGLNLETQQYARFAIDCGYHVELKEPESEWWQEIRVLLKYKDVTKEILDRWADRLAEVNRADHRVPVSTIRHWMDSWQHDLTVQRILNYSPFDGDRPARAQVLGERPSSLVD